MPRADQLLPKTEAKEIGGMKWTCVLFPARQGAKIARRLLKIVGPGVGQALGSFNDKAVDLEVEVVGRAVALLSERMDDPDVDALLYELVSTTTCEDGEGSVDAGKHYDMLFAGEYALLLQVISFVLEANYKIPFASWWAALAQKREAAKAKPKIARPPRATSSATS